MMLIFDLDGTLLDENKMVSINTMEYLKRMRKKGHKIVIATGRVKNSALDVTRGGEFVDAFICDTGALIYDNQENRELFVRHLSRDFAEYILNLYDKNKMNYIDICDHDYIYKLTDVPEDYPIIINSNNKKEILDKVGDIIHVGISFYDNKYALETYEKLKNEYKDLHVLLMQDSFSPRKWIEIMPKDCNKPHAIKWLANHYNIKRDDIIAFGDGLNDIEMLSTCGIGVAMANALDEVKNVANMITEKSNIEDGVVDFLEKYLS